MHERNFKDRKFYPALVKAGLPRIVFHNLRKTCATLLLESGANIKFVQQQLGHKDASITLGIYSQVNQIARQESVQKFESYVLG